MESGKGKVGPIGGQDVLKKYEMGILSGRMVGAKTYSVFSTSLKKGV